MEKKYTNVSITLRREKNNGILRIRNEYGDLDNPNRKDLNIISYITGSLDFELTRKVAKRITQSHSQYQTTSLVAWNKLEIENAIEELDEREKYILDQRYVVGKTQMEVANSLDISQAQVSRLEKKAIKELKKVLK